MNDSETISSSDTTKKDGSTDTRKQRDRQETLFILKKIERYLDNITRVECHSDHITTSRDGYVQVGKVKCGNAKMSLASEQLLREIDNLSNSEVGEKYKEAKRK
jgi:hypothetical protein